MLNFINILLAFPSVQVKGRDALYFFYRFMQYNAILWARNFLHQKEFDCNTYDGLAFSMMTLSTKYRMYILKEASLDIGHSSLFFCYINHEKIDKIVLLDPACFPKYFDIHSKNLFLKF